MDKFVKIPFGEKDKYHGVAILNVELIKHMWYTEGNEAVPNSTAVKLVPTLLVHYGDGRSTFTFNKEQAKILLEHIGINKEDK